MAYLQRVNLQDPNRQTIEQQQSPGGANNTLSPQPKQQNGVNPLLDVLGLTAAGIGGEALGGPVGAGVATGGYRALTNYLTGRPLGEDVAMTAATNAILPGILGKVFGGVGSKLTGAASKLLGVPTEDIFNSVVQKNPWMTQNTGKLADAAANFGYMKQPIADSLAQMPQDFKNISSQIEAKLQGSTAQVPLVNGAAGKPSLYDNFVSAMEKSPYSPGDPQYESGAQSVLNRMTNLGQDGQAGLADIYKEKSAVSDLLSKSFDKEARGLPLSPKEEANMAYFDALKTTMDQYGDSSIRDLNMQQHDLFTIAKAFGTQYAKTAGKAGARFSFNQFIPEGLGAFGANMAGMNPLLGAALGYGAEKFANSPHALNSSGALLKFLGNPSVTSGGVAAGQGILHSILAPNSTPSNMQGNQNQGNTQPEIQNNSSLPSQTISQPGGNVNTGGQIKLSSGEALPAQLPNADQIGNNIPGQIYSTDQYLADRQKWTDLAAANPYNPGVQTQADREISAIDARQQLNQRIQDINLQQMGLTPSQSQFILSAAPTWQTLGALQQAIQQEGGRDAFQTLIQSSPQVRQLKAITDQTGQYGHMLQLMNTASAEVAKMNAGASPTDFQVSLEQAFSPSNNVATNLANLDQSMKQMYAQYQQYAPFFHMQVNASQGQQQTSQEISTGSSLLNGLLQKAAQ